jgi:hypothetical protein
MKTNGAPGEIRTPDLLVRSQTLYPTELQARYPYCSDLKRAWEGSPGSHGSRCDEQASRQTSPAPGASHGSGGSAGRVRLRPGPQRGSRGSASSEAPATPTIWVPG